MHPRARDARPGRGRARAARRRRRARTRRTASRPARRRARRGRRSPRWSRSGGGPGGAIGTRAVERQPGCVGEQVPHGRAGRAGRLVEVDDALLGGDERGERADRLRDRGEAGRRGACRRGVAIVPSAPVTPAAAKGTSQPSIWRRASTAGRYYPGHGTPPDLGTLAVRARGRILAGSRRRLDGPRRRHRTDPAGRLAGARERLRAGAALPRDHRRGARAGRLLDRGRRPHADVRHGRRALGRRLARPRRGVRATSRPAATCVVASLLDPSWKVEIEAEAVIG